MSDWIAKDVGVVTEDGEVICEAPIHYLKSAKSWPKHANLIAASPIMLRALGAIYEDIAYMSLGESERLLVEEALKSTRSR